MYSPLLRRLAARAGDRALAVRAPLLRLGHRRLGGRALLTPELRRPSARRARSSACSARCFVLERQRHIATGGQIAGADRAQPRVHVRRSRDISVGGHVGGLIGGVVLMWLMLHVPALGRLQRPRALGGDRGQLSSSRTRRSAATSEAAQPPADDVGARARFVQCGLGRGQPGERHAERRAADVVEAELVAERDRARLAAVLAADAELEVRLRARGPRSTAIRIRSPTPSMSSTSNGFALEHAVLEVARSGTCPRRRRARTRASSASGRSCRTRRSRRPRRSRRRAARRAAPRSSSRRDARRSGASSAQTDSVSSRSRAQLLAEADERVHHLDERRRRRCARCTARAARAIARICIS